jgi:starvation-inducible DNA-binding protein
MKPQLTHTRNSFPGKTCLEMAALLQDRWADSIDLMMQAKQAHWNVKGPNSITLHQLFDNVYTETGEHVDMMAERIVQPGGVPRGTVRVAAEKSTLPEYPSDISSRREHVAELAHAIAFYGEQVRKAIETSNRLQDADKGDVFTEVSRRADSSLRIVEAHEQAEH